MFIDRGQRHVNCDITETIVYIWLCIVILRDNNINITT